MKRWLAVVVAVTVTVPVSDVKRLVFSPVSIEVPECSYQPRKSVSPASPIGKPVPVIVAWLIVHLCEGSKHESRDDHSKGGDSEGRETNRGHGEGCHGHPDYHVGQHVSLGVHGHVVDHGDSPGDHVPIVLFCTVTRQCIRC